MRTLLSRVQHWGPLPSEPPMPGLEVKVSGPGSAGELLL